MELYAAIVALEALKGSCIVNLTSDSQYLVKGMSLGWAAKWKTQGWMRTRKEPAINADLWERLLALCSKHRVSFRWVRGHNGHPENERCDQLAGQGIRLETVPDDLVYQAR